MLAAEGMAIAFVICLRGVSIEMKQRVCDARRLHTLGWLLGRPSGGSLPPLARAQQRTHIRLVGVWIELSVLDEARPDIFGGTGALKQIWKQT